VALAQDGAGVPKEAERAWMSASTPIDSEFRTRYWKVGTRRPDDCRDEYQLDRARIIHSAAFRRLQAKTQVMGVGEGDFHRTRLTHSIETAQIGEGLLLQFKDAYKEHPVFKWLPSPELIVAACYAHDLGHPPFGHAGEEALQAKMRTCYRGGFEGNGQTLRILTRLEKRFSKKGIDPTRRLILAVLKYPMAYSEHDLSKHPFKPPKCYFDTEREIVDWALSDPFKADEKKKFGD